MKPRKYTDQALKEAVASSYSIRSVLQKLGLTPAGGNYETIRKQICALGLDDSHFLGQAILRGKSHTINTRPIESILVHAKLENTWRLKNRLLAEGLKPYQCERCLNSEWLGQLIPLELHHKDGDRTNNSLDNIELLCPSCHSFTDNYRGGKKKV